MKLDVRLPVVLTTAAKRKMQRNLGGKPFWDQRDVMDLMALAYEAGKRDSCEETALYGIVEVRP